jgi:hypothetical protein
MKSKRAWKTKEVDGRTYMICQNSEPEHSKYPDWGPEVGVCDEWEEIGKDTGAVLCSKCTQRSLKF